MYVTVQCHCHNGPVSMRSVYLEVCSTLAGNLLSVESGLLTTHRWSLQDADGQQAESSTETTDFIPRRAQPDDGAGQLQKREGENERGKRGGMLLFLPRPRLAVGFGRMKILLMTNMRNTGGLLVCGSESKEPRDTRRPQGEAGLAGSAQTHR